MKIKDYAGRTFGEITKDLSERSGTVKIGMKDSSAFVYCGSKSYLTPYRVGAIELRLRSMMAERVTNALNSINVKINTTPTPEDYIRKCWKNNESIGTWEGYLLTIDEHWRKLEQLKEALDDRRIEAETRTELTERKVIETYPSIDVEDQLIIILEGCEPGEYWTVKEYEFEHGSTQPVTQETEETEETQTVTETETQMIQETEEEGEAAEEAEEGESDG